MSINWGTKIAILYIGFVVLILSLVIATTFQKTSLVSENYYHDETIFQQRINAMQATESMHDSILVHADANKVNLDFPKQFDGKAVTGSVHFYAPANEDADRIIALNTNNSSVVVERNKLAKARYEVQVSWTVSGKEYYESLPLNLQ